MRSKKEWYRLMCMASVVAPMVVLPVTMVTAQENANVLDPSAPSGEALPDFGASSLETTATGLPVLFFRDHVLGDGVFDDALTNLASELGLDVTSTNDAATFTDKLDDQDWACVIALNQNMYGTSLFATQLTDYVNNGGRAIFADWTLNSSGETDLYSAFEVAGTGNENQTPITTDAHSVWSGVPASVSLSNPGWFHWSFGFPAVSGGVPTGTFPNGDAAIVIGNNGATAFNGFLSDTFSNHAEGVQIAENEINAICFPTIPVAIDIKPGSDENSINLCSNGAVPVAILGSATFDVNDIDSDSLRLADAAVKVVGKKNKSLCSVEDVNDDYYDDLVCHFNTTELGDMLDGTSTLATVKGETAEGTPIEGSDTITIVKDECE